MTTRSEVARLRDEASQALKTLRPDQALASYLELERVDPESDWARRAAAVYMMLGRSQDAAEALLRAERWYSKRGEVLKAAAVCKHVLQIDPNHEEALRRVRSLKSEWDKARGSGSLPPPSSPTAPSRAGSIIRRMSPADGLEQMPLRDVVPGAKQASGRGSGSSGIYRIPLHEQEDNPPIEIALEPPTEANESAGTVVLDEHGNVKRISAADAAAQRARAEALEDEMIASVEREVRVAEEVNAKLSSNPLFSELDEKSFATLVMHARLVDLAAREVLFRQGDAGNALYVIAEGKVGVIDEGPPRCGVARLGDGDFFGEIALLTDQPRTATIVGLEDTKLIAIDRDVVLELISAEPRFLTALLRFLRDRLAGKLMSTNPIFTTLSERDRAALRTRFRFLEVDAGAVLLEEGKMPDGLLLLLTGSAEVVRQHKGSRVALGRIAGGDLSGEMALLSSKPSLWTVRAEKKCLVLELPAEAFLKIVRARPEAMAFVQQIVDQRTARAKAILSGSASFAEGHVRF
jgi:cAMP-dependent protein kinase regulator